MTYFLGKKSNSSRLFEIPEKITRKLLQNILIQKIGMEELRGKEGLETISIAVLNSRLEATLKVIEMVPGYFFFIFFSVIFSL